MAFWGFDTQRYTLKYRFPAAAYDLECAGRAAYGPGGPNGRVVHIRLDEHDRRIFTPPTAVLRRSAGTADAVRWTGSQRTGTNVAQFSELTLKPVALAFQLFDHRIHLTVLHPDSEYAVRVEPHQALCSCLDACQHLPAVHPPRFEALRRPRYAAYDPSSGQNQETNHGA